ncbi:hypothetical protein D2Q93_03130 [Alicyclobacillaceae bacterium I2511]|nr:hypothetical protein D2Q93_03130 [Alicyclobacillaceae bacterium I2511]
MTNEHRDLSWARREELGFIRRVADWTDTVVSGHRWYRTDFLDLREQSLVQAVVRRDGLAVAWFGGGLGAERQRALLMPDDWKPQATDFEVDVLQVQRLDGGALSHGAVLGSLLGTGVDRRKTGDIQLSDSVALVAVCKELTDFLWTQWRQIGRHGCSVSLCTSVVFAPQAYEWKQVNVASFRLDAVLAQVCHYSREQAQTLIKQGKVKLNFVEWVKPDELVQMKDIISVRGFGRIFVREVVGTSRKGREWINVGILLSRLESSDD